MTAPDRRIVGITCVPGTASQPPRARFQLECGHVVLEPLVADLITRAAVSWVIPCPACLAARAVSR